MLNFDRERFLRIQQGAVALKEQMDEVIDQLSKKGFENLFFIGSGGAAILMQPAAHFLRKHSDLPVFTEMASELMLLDLAQCNEKSLVVLPSLSGTTSETVTAANYCKAKGAVTISLVGHAGTPLAEATDYTFINFAEDDTSCESFYLQTYLLAARILYNRGQFSDYERFVGEMADLPTLLIEVKKATEEKAREFAAKYKDETYHILVGSGNSWPETYYYGMCILEEMQWIKTRPVHASDFFHGTLELVESDTSLLLLKGEDSTRPLMDRVEKFAKGYTKELTIFDTKDYELAGISDDLRGYFSPIVLATLLERVSSHLEKARNHPLTTRRYYRRVQY